MGRHIQAICRFCRQEGEKLFLKGEKCATEKCPFSRRSYAPGQHGKKPVRATEYRIRLREKQKARKIYGLTERQFRNYYFKALKKKGATGEKLLEFLERRLDNVVYRFGFVLSRQQARQLIRHGHIKVNKRKINIPSYQLKAGEVIKGEEKILPLFKANLEKFPDRVLPAWLAYADETGGKVVALPKREDITTSLEERLIVEYYSR